MNIAYNQIIEKLKKANIEYEIIKHKSITNVEEGNQIFKNCSNCFKTLAFYTKSDQYLITISALDKLDFKKLTQKLKIKRNDLKMISNKKLLELGYNIGSISPIDISGMINICDKKIRKYDKIYCGVGDNKKTLLISTENLLKITDTQIIDIVK